jgi:hypothetical protein
MIEGSWLQKALGAQTVKQTFELALDSCVDAECDFDEFRFD